MPRSTAISDISRFGKMVSVLAKYGFGSILNRMGLSQFKNTDSIETFAENPSRTASRLRCAIEELGTTYIKFGQMLSTRMDILSQEYIDELEKLQDNSPELPFETVQRILKESLAQPVDEIFASIDPTPLGTASIAQTHRATLKDGSSVVIKVQRPNLRSLVQSDIDILISFARLLENNIEEISYFHPTEILENFESSIFKELNFKNEASNIRYFSEKYKDREDCIFPDPYDDLSTKDVLVMREIVGQKITTLPAGTPEAKDVAERLLSLAFSMIFDDGVFHGDPHPGNVFITEDYKIALLDFGLIGSFSQRQRELLTNIVIAFSIGNSEIVARDILKLGHPTQRVPLDALQADIERIIAEHLKGSLNEIDVAAFAFHFVQTGQKYGVQIPSEFTCAVRALLNIEGIIQYLYPDLNVFGLIHQYSQKLIKESYTPQKIGNQVLQTAISSMGMVQTLPSHVEQVMMDLRHDGFPVKLQDRAAEPLCDAINSLATKVCISFLLTAFLISFAISGHSTAFDISVVAGLVWLFILIFWHKANKYVPTRLKIQPFIHRRKRNRLE